MNHHVTSQTAFNTLRVLTTVLILLAGSALAAPDAANKNLFRSAPTYPVGTFPDHVAVADFNGDHIQDIALSDRAGGVNVMLGKGSGRFELPVFYVAGEICEGIVAADFNRDGKLDLLLADQQVTGVVDILLGNGDGSFQAPLTFPAGVSGPTEIAVGDLNGDGLPDVVVNDRNSNIIAVLLGTAGTALAAPVTYPVNNSPSTIAIADFNLDGKPDLAVANAGSSGGPGTTVSILLGNGDGTFQPKIDASVGREPFDLVAADFNDDGKVDVATANFLDGTATVLIGNGDGTFQSRVDYTVSSRLRRLE